MLARLDGCEMSFMRQPGETISRLEIWQFERLLLYWDRDCSRLDAPAARLAALTFALTHQDYLAHFDDIPFSHCSAYFRLTFTGNSQPPNLPERFGFADMNLDDVEAAAA